MRRRSELAGWAVLGLTLAGCGSDAGSNAAGNAEGTDVPTIVATTTIWGDVVSNVACDGLADVRTIVPPGGDPHSFEPSLRDRETMTNAAVIVTNGLGLEESLADLIDTLESDGVMVVSVGDGVDTLAGGIDDDDHDEGEDDHGGVDPHIWFDPVRVATALPALADALVTAGLDRAAIDRCVADYTEQLTELDGDIAAIVATLPEDERLLVTNHDSLRYFADRYGFQVLGSVIPSPSSLAATNPADLERLASIIADSGVPAIFAETQHSSSDTVALAERVGDVEVITLQTDTLGESGSPTGTYIEWFDVTAETVVDALR